MENKELDSLDILSILSFVLGYENLIENRQQSKQNDVQSANDKQAEYLLNHLHTMFEDQNEKIDRILSILEEINESN